MSDPPTRLQAVWSEGARALREGRAADALAAFRQITAAGAAPPPVWLGIAMACKNLGDRHGERAALDALLAQDPRDVRGLIAMADHFADAGDGRAAASYYTAAVKVVAAAGRVEPGMEAEVGRAQHMREQYADRFQAHLVDSLNGQGLDAPEARRVRKAVELLSGKSEVYLQQPKNFYFPELPNIEYADRADFPWLDKVEAATGDIRAELVRVLDEDSAFSPYVVAEPNRPFFDDHGMLGNPAWSAFYLWRNGELVAENAARCPATVSALEDAPLCRVPGRTPSVLFSLLRPGAHIAPHHGFTNARYICHLPLIVPDNCAMRVGSQTRPWREGEACVFDDSIEHEAWNRNADRLRVVLIFDIWRPELSVMERALISETLQAVGRYSG